MPATMLYCWLRLRRLHTSLRKYISTLFDQVDDESDSSQPGAFLNARGRRFMSESNTLENSNSALFSKTIGNLSIDTGSLTIMLDIFEEALSCAVCLEEFRKVPKILPTCGHSFCTPCIEHWYEFSGGTATGILGCPVCKCKTNLRVLRGGARSSRKHSSLFGHHSEKQQRLPPPPQPSALRKLLCDSPTVAAVLKLRKRLLKLAPGNSGRGDLSKSVHVSALESMVTSLQTLLTCRSCHFRLEEPRMLPACRHSFCTACLQKIYKPMSTTNGDDTATVVCPVCSTLYRFNYHSSPTSPPVSTTKSALSDGKCPLESVKPLPPKETLATYLPFDYVLGCLLDAVPEKL